MIGGDRYGYLSTRPLSDLINQLQMFRIMLCCLLAVLLLACIEKQPVQQVALKEKEWPDSLLTASGDRIITRTFDTLRASLVSAIQSQGFPGAIEFCNVKAGALTSLYGDSVSVRRTAIRFRNPANKPDSLEAQILQSWNRLMNDGQKLQPRMIRTGGQIHYFKPIITQGMCLNCHGSPKGQILPATAEAIRKHYPDDLAIDFQEGDLRGAWHLIFDKSP